MKKGFTLIELIAVIAIIGIISMIAVPNVMNIFNNKSEELYNNTVKELVRISQSYLIDNPDLYDDIDINGYIDISINQLCTNKYIDCPVLDPRNNSEINGNVRITLVDNDYVYTFNRIN